MQPNMFLSLSDVAKAMTLRKTTEQGEKVEWLRIQWIQVRKTDPYRMFFEYSVQQELEFQCVSFAKKGRLIYPEPAYRKPDELRPLAAEKVNDLKKLLKYVPPVHHEFYQQLNETSEKSPNFVEDELLGQSQDENQNIVISSADA